MTGLLIGFPGWKTTIIGAILALLVIAAQLLQTKLTAGAKTISTNGMT